MKFNRDRLSIDVVTTGGVIFLTIASFILSYDALRQLAQMAGVTFWLSWLYPFILDAVILVAAMSTLRMTKKRDKAAYAWVLVVTFTGLSIAGNVLHIDTGAAWYEEYVTLWLSYAVFSIPPIALALSFHLWITHVKSDIKRGIVKPQLDDVKTVPEDVTPKPQVKKPVVKPVKVNDKPSIARLMRSDGKPVALIAAELDVTPKTIYRWTDNGNGK